MSDARGSLGSLATRSSRLAALRSRCLALALIPLHRAPQTFFEIDLGLVIQGHARARNGGQRMLDVALALRTMLDLPGIAGEFPKQFNRLVQVGARSGRD